MTLENDDLEELTTEIRRLIASNKAFLERVNDEDEEYEDEGEESDPATDEELEDFEEL